ncbi:MAG TPA: hypothetical protein VHM22_11940, partial [Bradyrhizobium sp.]|nr:hypothetical protein [Bradyrhizobium sp.]
IKELNRLARKLGVRLRQSYLRIARTAAMMAGRYAHAKQFKLKLTDFCERHGVSLDWVILGALLRCER